MNIDALAFQKCRLEIKKEGGCSYSNKLTAIFDVVFLKKFSHTKDTHSRKACLFRNDRS